MEERGHSELKKGPRGQVLVFGALVALTLATAGASYAGLGAGVALGIAAAQGALIVFVLMHLGGERRSIRALAGFTLFFVAAMLTLIMAAFHDTLGGTERVVAPAAAGAEEH